MEEAQQIELEVPGVRALFIGEDDRVEAEAGTLAQRKGPLAFFEPGYAERRQLHLAQFFLDHGGQLGRSWLMAATPGPSSGHRRTLLEMVAGGSISHSTQGYI